MDEMGDMSQIADAMKNLQRAQMCTGNCTGWGLTPGKMRKSGGKGRGGRGVGTWADDNPWSMPEGIDEYFDNSEFTQPDQAGKGNTDRSTDLTDALEGTRIKGQFQPGAPMPSVSIKGVSIKGESKVRFSETSSTTQTDDQAALDQQRVPRAYQNSVRDYFDDRK